MAERIEVVHLFLTPQVCLYKLLKYSGVARSTWYYSIKNKSFDKRSLNKGRTAPGFTVNRDGVIIKDDNIIDLLREYRSRIEFKNGGGYTKLTHYLKRDCGFYINKKKIYRICKNNGILLKQRRKIKRSWRRISVNQIITRPNKLWEFDLKYGQVHGENRFFFILAFVDVYSRKVVGNYTGSSCKSGDLKFTLLQSIINEDITNEDDLIIRSDNGSQMSSLDFHKYLEKLEIKLSHEFIPPATPNKNAHVESFFSILENEFIQTRYFNNLSEAYVQTQSFINFYNEKRIHGSLKFRTPNEIVIDYKTGKKLDLKPVKV